jgi:hypothetical protein
MRIKDRLAKLLATENVTVRHSSAAKTASFDIKERVLTLPVLKDMDGDITDLMVGHEVGHALYTPVEGWETAITKDGINQNILNIVEDPRIEKLVKRKYPGLRKAFISGYRSLMEQGFFGDRLDFEAMNVLDRLNMHFKGGASMQVPFDNAELWMVKGIEACETWDHVVEITKKIMMAYSELLNQTTSQMDELMSGYGVPGDSDEDDQDDMPGEWGQSLPEASETPDGESMDTDKFDEQTHAVEDEEASTVEEWKRNQSNLLKDDGKQIFYMGLPKANLKRVIIPHKRVRKDMSRLIQKSMATNDLDRMKYYGHNPDKFTKDVIKVKYNKFRNTSMKIVNYMVKEFERKKAADEYKRVSVDKTGVLNVTKLHEYKYNDDLFLKRAIVHDGKNHGLVFLLDWSASMTYHMENTVKQLLSLVWFCNKVNVPFEVYAFTSGWYDPDIPLEHRSRVRSENTPLFDAKHGEVHFRNDSGFRLLNMLSSRMSARELNEQAFNLFTVGYYSGQRAVRGLALGNYDMASTPMVEALVAMLQIVPSFRDYHKIDKVNFICLTDGEANSTFDTLRNEYDDDLDNKNPVTWIPTGHNVEVIYDDPTTRKTYKVNNPMGKWLRAWQGEEQSQFLLRLLKDRYDINTIGIFLDSNRSLGRGLLEKYLGWFSMNRAAHKNARKECRTHGFATVKTGGFDEYYLVPSSSVQISDETGLDIDREEASAMKKGQLKNLFAKNQKRKFGNRIMVNRMMDLIT